MEPGQADELPTSTPANTEGSGYIPTAEEEREHRRQALSELAQQLSSPGQQPAYVRQTPSANTTITQRTESVTRPSRRRPRWLVIVATLLALLLIAALLVSRLLPPVDSQLVSHMVTIDPGAQNLACATDAAWSPDGTSIAVLGYQTNCPNTDSAQPYDSGQVTIYNSVTGKVQTTLSLDQLTLRAHQVMVGQPATSSDGTVFAPFTATRLCSGRQTDNNWPFHLWYRSTPTTSRCRMSRHPHSPRRGCYSPT
jgi:hypothetical protein